ncbi:MAG: SLBB domain-containing protein, partial [Calditerrivibrio sp.]|nr:SLBB domain-containing protein [Calditerrivibrio sp.]
GTKYVVCNADEGDPGAFMDRSILEGDPHSIIEGMIIAGYAVGASHGYIYVRAEYPLAIKRLKIAIKQAESYRLLGKNIGNSNFSFDLELRLGAGAFVCGEETALISSIEGKKGNPIPRPPYPAEAGVRGYPTLVNNVETFANIAAIIEKGADWFNSIGTEKSKGTKVFALAGNVKNTGLVEVPMGITLKELIFDIGGGIPDGKRFKAVQTGGPSGGCIPEEFLNTPIDYESMLSLNSIMGSGGMIVMDEDTCMVSVAKYFMEFCMTESCGKCVPCRTGTLQIYDILDRISRGEGKEDDIPIMLNLCNLMKKTSLCGLGQSAPNPVLSTFKYFKDEYFEHILHKFCPAGRCKFEGVKEDED